MYTTITIGSGTGSRNIRKIAIQNLNQAVLAADALQPDGNHYISFHHRQINSLLLFSFPCHWQVLSFDAEGIFIGSAWAVNTTAATFTLLTQAKTVLLLHPADQLSTTALGRLTHLHSIAWNV